MARFGPGFPAGRRRRISDESVQLELTSYTLEPSPAWNGEAGSGFVSPPSDPERLTAKPAVRLLVPDHQYFLNALEVGVAAYANNNGSLLDNCGLQHVVFHFEGNSITAERPNFRSFTRADGSTYSVLGWWVTLERPAQQQGEAHLYVEAVPQDPTMQARVIGPHSFSPHEEFAQTGTLHDYEIEVDPDEDEIAGQRYQTLVDAYKYLGLQQSQNPRIRI